MILSHTPRREGAKKKLILAMLLLSIIFSRRFDEN